MLTEKQLEMFGDRGAAVFQSAEQDIIADIARRVKKTRRFTETAELQAQALRAAGVSTQEIRKEVMKILNADDEYKKYVANNTKQYKRDVIHAIRQMEKDAVAEGDRIIADAGDMAFNKDLSAWHRAGTELAKDTGIVKIMEEMSHATEGTFKNLTKTMGFKGAYDFTSVQNAYIKYLDKAVMKMATGAYSFDVAVNDAIREMAQSGLRSVDYASGRTYQLDTAARMCVRTSCHQLSAKITERNCDVTGTDLVEVSAHWGARPEHAEWQGKIYSRSGHNKNYPPFSETQYGAVNGLCGVNCRHTFYPFFEGISEPTKWDKEPDPKEYNGRTYKYYDMTQKQRQMERGIRATKREIEAQKAIGGNVNELEAQKRKQIAEYHKFSKEMGIRPKDNRLMVIKGSSDFSKQMEELTNRNKYLRITEIPASSISQKIKEGEYSTKLKIQEYQKHVEGTVKYNEYLNARKCKGGNPQSIITVSAKTVQNIIVNKAGTGIIKVDRKGNARPQEQITCDTVIGKYYCNGNYIDTKKAVIHYSKKGAHIVPIRGANYD